MRPTDRVPSNNVSEEVKSERPLRQKETYHSSCSANKPGFCESLRACCRHITHEELNAMPKGRVSAFDKVGCLLPTAPCWVLPDRVGAAPALEGHVTAASQPLLLLPLVLGRDNSTQRAPHGSQKYHCKVSRCRKKEKDLYNRQIVQLLNSLNKSLTLHSDLCFPGLFLQAWISLTSSLSEYPK